MTRPLILCWTFWGFLLATGNPLPAEAVRKPSLPALRTGPTQADVVPAIASASRSADYEANSLAELVYEDGVAPQCGHGPACGTPDCCAESPLSPHVAPGNLVPHTPYLAEPKLYYYFRPYHWRHILEQQESVMRYGGDPRHPYANREFEGIYEGLE
jgi:hypothetical protein